MTMDLMTLGREDMAQRALVLRISKDNPFTSFWTIDYLVERAKSKGYSYKGLGRESQIPEEGRVEERNQRV